MNIRTRLAVQFSLLASFILGAAFLVVYLRAAEFRQEQFRDRLYERGKNVANLLLQVDEVDERLLRKIELNSTVRLPEEVIALFDDHDEQVLRLGVDKDLPFGEMIAIAKKQGTMFRVDDGRESIGFVFQNGTLSNTVIASGFDRFGRGKLNDQAKVMLATFLIGLVTIFLIGRVFAKRALSPFQRLVQELHSIGASDLSKRVDPGNGTDEKAQLASSFNALLERLQGAFTAQKNFVSNASHEMRNPLTAVSGQIDVLLLRSRSEKEYETALRSVQEDLRSVNRLNDRLLLMAQAEIESNLIHFDPVRLDEVIWVAREEVLRMNNAYSVDVKIADVESDMDLTVNGNTILLRSMITNLTENACKYSPDHHATITVRGGHKEVVLRVDDNGPGIAEAEQQRIFEHFFRARNTGGAHGHGIGLALVKRIAEQHGGKVKLESELGKGSSFIVLLPNGGPLPSQHT
ncbi:MAG: HAMP domain-containing protein [Flavobacteriales bacterium]|nr:HAMP domain-containing protein [Flavobacteriales bacterium]MBP6642297.1 HAMP domain-containing protein [Flavobacteriales bacterium]MBP7156694.1 HAMP domain-containing protein [Flavobacteriales bacterium]HQV76292.1 ATP-binding protein [Flavobacteriales bacterium]HQW41926.1 ATP-binding protein [Flavobacteriales bacterium]